MFRKLFGGNPDKVTLGREEFQIHFLGEGLQVVNVRDQVCSLLEFPAHHGLGPNEAMVKESVEKGIPVIAAGSHTSNIGKVTISDKYMQPEQVQWFATVGEAIDYYQAISKEISDKVKGNMDGKSEGVTTADAAKLESKLKNPGEKAHASDVGKVEERQGGDFPSIGGGGAG